eukprot:1523682-Rhodomonas_salina.3
MQEINGVFGEHPTQLIVKDGEETGRTADIARVSPEDQVLRSWSVAAQEYPPLPVGSASAAADGSLILS